MGPDSLEICSKLHTESVHPIELFSKMKIETITESPFHHTYRNQDIKTDKASSSSPQYRRKDLSTVVLPDSPIVTCSTTDYGYLFYGGGNHYSYAYELGATVGCAEYSADIANYNFNYNPSTGTYARIC